MQAMFVLVLAFAACTLSQFPPQPQEVTILNSVRTPGVSISYKEVCVLSEYQVYRIIFLLAIFEPD